MIDNLHDKFNRVKKLLNKREEKAMSKELILDECKRKVLVAIDKFIENNQDDLKYEGDLKAHIDRLDQKHVDGKIGP